MSGPGPSSWPWKTSKPSAELLRKFAELARNDSSPVVRLYLASALQRLPAEQRWDILEGLLDARRGRERTTTCR